MDYTFDELLPIIKNLSELYTRKESSSITYEMAEQLMEAIIYCIKENDSNILDTDCNELIKLDEIQNAEAFYQHGYNLVLNKVKKSKNIYEKMIIHFESYGNLNYYDTVVKGLPSFFIHYDTKFNPQNHILTLDYPTLKPLNNLCGVDAVYQYISYIQLEQIFLSAFPYSYIIETLTQFHINYKGLFMNICSIVLRNIVCHMMVKKNLNDKEIIVEEMEYLNSFISITPKAELELKLIEMIKILVENKYNNNNELFNYLKADIKEFTSELINAAKNNYLNKLFRL